MKKHKRILLSLAIVCTLVCMQLSSAIVALAESKTPLKVSDVGDKNLYAVLAAAADGSGSNGGILYKEDAESMSSFYTSDGNIYSSVQAVQSFANLAKVCPNLSSISIDSNVSSVALPSLVDEIVKMDKLTSIVVRSSDLTTSQLEAICNKNNNENISYFDADINGTLDLSAMEKLTGLCSLSVECSSNASISGAESLSKLAKLTDVSCSGTAANILEVVNNISSSVKSLRVGTSYWSNTKLNLDLSRFGDLNLAQVTGYVDSVTGLGNLEKLEDLYIINTYGSKNELNVDVTALPQNLKHLSLQNCNLGTDTLTTLPQLLIACYLTGCGIKDASVVKNCTNLVILDLSNNNIIQTLDLSKLTALNDLNLSNNNLTQVPNVLGANNLSYLNLSKNHIVDISGLTEAKKLMHLNLEYNDISELPDMTSLTKLTPYRYGGSMNQDFSSDGYYDFALKGNKLTEAALQNKVPSDCIQDKYWVYAATMQKNNVNMAYFTTMNTEILSKLLENSDYYVSAYTSLKSFTLSDEMIQYIKDNKKTFSIKYVDGGGTQESVNVDGSKLTADTQTVDINFTGMEYGTSNTEIDNVFSKYGSVAYYYKTPELPAGISGISYSAGAFEGLDRSKNYNQYVYNPSDRTFSYVNTVIHSSSAPNYNSGTTPYTFFVDTDKDGLVGVDQYQCSYPSGGTFTTTTPYYKMLDDTVVKNLIASKTGSVSIYTTATSLNLSADTVSLLKSKGWTMWLNKYDPSTHMTAANITVSSWNIANVALNYTMPDVTVANGNDVIAKEFKGGSISRYFKVNSQGSKVNGVSASLAFPLTNLGDANLYTYYDGVCIPLAFNAYTSSYDISNLSSSEYFTTLASNDTFIKRINFSNSYLTDVSSSYISKIVKFISNNNMYIPINTVEDKIVLDAEAVEALKNNSKNINIQFLSSATGNVIGSAMVSGSALKSSDISGEITINRPEVGFSTSNQEFSEALPTGIAAIYVTNTSDMVKGVSYYYRNSDVLNEKLGADQYTALTLTNGMPIIFYTGISSSSIPMNDGTYALVKSASYTPSTPSDTPSTPSDTPATPSDTPATPSDTPTEAPTETPTQAPTETPTQKPTEAPTETPTQKPTEAPTQAPTQKPTEAPTQAPTQPTEPASTNQQGLNSVAQTVKSDVVVASGEVDKVLGDKLTNSQLAKVETYSRVVAPVLDSDVFSRMKQNQKDITVGVTDENNNLEYSWTFNNDTIYDPHMNIDLSISFDTDRADAVKAITGREDVVYLSFAHHGALPGPATIKTYVGKQYKNGDIVYLYYYNEEMNRVETVGNGGLVVADGYVEYTINHCSLYFLSKEQPAAVNAVETNDNNPVPLLTVPASVDDSVQTADTTNAFAYAMSAATGVVLMGTVLVWKRKRTEN